MIKLKPGTYFSNAGPKVRGKWTRKLRTEASRMAKTSDLKYEQATKDIMELRR